MTADTSTPTLYPGLQYRDADAAMKWLEEVLGCKRREDYRDEQGNVVHAELDFDGAVVMLSSAGVGREPFRSLPAGGRLVYCALDEVDSLYERVRGAGGDIAVELMETEYGSRDFTVRDPEGNLWAFGTYRPPIPGLTVASGGNTRPGATSDGRRPPVAEVGIWSAIIEQSSQLASAQPARGEHEVGEDQLAAPLDM
jgi:uncharacterized glyoxalase superfamily protein PhnB